MVLSSLRGRIFNFGLKILQRLATRRIICMYILEMAVQLVLASETIIVVAILAPENRTRKSFGIGAMLGFAMTFEIKYALGGVLAVILFACKSSARLLLNVMAPLVFLDCPLHCVDLRPQVML